MSNYTCRSCASEYGIILLFDEDNRTIVLEKLLECTKIKVDKNDGLPEHLCEKCFGQLETAYNFKLQCESMDKYFREIACAHTITENNTNDETSKHLIILNVESEFTSLENSKSNDDINTDNINEKFMEFTYEYMSLDEIIVNDTVTNDPENLEKDSPIANLKCERCDTEFENKEELNKHTEQAGSHRFHCQKCNRWFSRKNHFNIHMETHGHIEYFNCSLCSSKYKHRRNLRRHIEDNHKNELPFVCKVCGERFSSDEEFSNHKTWHIEKKYSCDICGKKVTTSRHLELHQKSHVPRIIKRRKYVYKDNKRSYLCAQCGKISTRLSTHFKHLQTHTDEKPLECSFCQKRFKFHNTLNSHIRIHTGEKPFKCDICSMSFRQSQQLKSHKFIHSGIKPHKCKFCERAFIQKGNLVAHERLHTGEKPYKCKICGNAFHNSKGLKRHKHDDLNESQE